MSEFTRWLNREFLSWQNSTGERKTLKQFAQYIGIKPTTLSSWLNADVLPTGDNVHLLADRLDPKIYDILGVVPPLPEILQEAKGLYLSMPPDKREDFTEYLETVFRKWAEENGYKLTRVK